MDIVRTIAKQELGLDVSPVLTSDAARRSKGCTATRTSAMSWPPGVAVIRGRASRRFLETLATDLALVRNVQVIAWLAGPAGGRG